MVWGWQSVGESAVGAMQRFFVSYTGVDVRWAEWVAWTLEAEGHEALIQAWDFGPGSHFVGEMQRALDGSRRTVAVLSAAYLASAFASEEWQAAWAANPDGSKRLLLVVRVEDCARPGLLRQVVSVDLFDVDREVARERLLAAIALGPRKPATEPDFPAQPRVVAGGGATAAVFPSDLPAVWNVPPRLSRFVGRDEQLAAVERELAAQGVAGVCAVHGVGGVGKTALAIEYAHRHAGDFDVVWWVAAQDPAFVAGDVAALGSELGLGDGAEWPAVAGVLRAQGRRWLLVLDNVDDAALIGPFRPSDAGGRLLVTSRLAGLDGFGGAVEVGEFSAEEAVGLLAGRVDGIDTGVAGRIVALLGSLPLAVEQAAGYLRQTGTPPADYVELLETRLGDMLRRGWVAERPGVTVANLWELSMARLRAERPAAAELLELCALCGPEPIPLDLVTGGVAVLADGPLRRAAGDLVEWADTAGALVGFSLARRDGTTLTVHRLIAAATRAGMDPARQTTADAALVRLVTATLPGDVGNPAAWPRWRELFPHARTVLATDDSDRDEETLRRVAWLSDRCGVYLADQGRPDLAIAYLHRGLSLNEGHLGPDHQNTLTARNNLASAYETAGRVGEAIDLFEQVVADRLRVVGPDDPDTLSSRHNLASAYQAAGRVEDAIDLYERVLADRLRMLDPDHPNTLASRHNLAYAYAANGRAAEAIDLYEQILGDRLRVLGPDHPDTLSSRQNLAGTYQAAGRVEDAIDLFDEVLADSTRVLGADHPNTLSARHNLAYTYQLAGQMDDAIDLFEEVVGDRLRVHGPDHPNTLASRHNLAYAYQAAGRVEDAIDLFDEVLADSTRVLGADHPATLSARHYLARAHQEAGWVDDAVDLFEEVVADQLRVFGPDHPHTLTAASSRAFAYQEAERLDDAIVLFEQVVADQLRVLGPDHPDTLASRHHLAFAHQEAGRLDDAIVLFEQVVADQLRVLGPDHPDTLTIRNNLAAAYQAAGRVEDAIRLYEKVLADSARVLGPDHPGTLTARNNLAAGYEAAGRVDDAIGLFEQVLADVTRALSPDHPLIDTVGANLDAARENHGQASTG